MATLYILLSVLHVNGEIVLIWIIKKIFEGGD
jgi:hypothetical protein